MKIDTVVTMGRVDHLRYRIVFPVHTDQQRDHDILLATECVLEAKESILPVPLCETSAFKLLAVAIVHSQSQDGAVETALLQTGEYGEPETDRAKKLVEEAKKLLNRGIREVRGDVW